MTSNDLFANAVVVEFSGSEFISPATDNSVASVGYEPGEVQPATYNAGRTMWWKYIPGSDGTANFDTQLTAQDTELAVYTGSTLASLTKVGSDSDSGAGSSSVINGIPVTAGTTYYIQVGSYNNNVMSYILRVTGPSTTVTTPPPARDFDVMLMTGGSVKMSWASSPFETYEVQVDSNPVVTLSAGTSEYTIADLSDGVTYTLKLRGLNSVGPGPTTEKSVKYVTPLLSDTFDRANSTTVLGSPQIGPAPVIQQGVFGISSNRAYAPTAPAIATYDLGTPNVAMSADISFGATTSRWLSFVFGYVSTTSFWQVLVDIATTTQCHISKYTAGGSVLYQQLPLPPAAASTGFFNLRAGHHNGFITVFYDNTRVATFQLESPLASNLHGIRIGSTTFRVDNLVVFESFPPSHLNPNVAVREPGVMGFAPSSASSFLYRGRDTKIQDIAEMV